jgi:hypothetical protein
VASLRAHFWPRGSAIFMAESGSIANYKIRGLQALSGFDPETTSAQFWSLAEPVTRRGTCRASHPFPFNLNLEAREFADMTRPYAASRRYHPPEAQERGKGDPHQDRDSASQPSPPSRVLRLVPTDQFTATPSA